MESPKRKMDPFYFILNVTNKSRMTKYPVTLCGIGYKKKCINTYCRQCSIYPLYHCGGFIFIWPKPHKKYICRPVKSRKTSEYLCKVFEILHNC